MKKIWNVCKRDRKLCDHLAEKCGVSPIVAQLLINRGVTDPSEASSFLNCDISALHDPRLLKDVEKASLRIKAAIANGEKLMVYGDYDADGVTAASLLTLVLREMGGHIVTYIPDRIEEGYGLNHEAIHAAARQNVKVLVTVDCGVSDRKEIEHLSSLGITTIVTDHHKISPNDFPDKAYAVINPLQRDCGYPFRHLSGVGVAYKLAEVLTAGTSYDLMQHLDLVAIGTIQDIVPQTGENRILTKYGIREINRTAKVGLQALIKAGGLKGKEISSQQVAFILGPRINAAGRVGSCRMALNLFLSEDAPEADEIAKRLNDDNRNRQNIERRILKHK